MPKLLKLLLSVVLSVVLLLAVIPPVESEAIATSTLVAYCVYSVMATIGFSLGFSLCRELATEAADYVIHNMPDDIRQACENAAYTWKHGIPVVNMAYDKFCELRTYIRSVISNAYVPSGSDGELLPEGSSRYVIHTFTGDGSFQRFYGNALLTWTCINKVISISIAFGGNELFVSGDLNWSRYSTVEVCEAVFGNPDVSCPSGVPGAILPLTLTTSIGGHNYSVFPQKIAGVDIHVKSVSGSPILYDGTNVITSEDGTFTYTGPEDCTFYNCHTLMYHIVTGFSASASTDWTDLWNVYDDSLDFSNMIDASGKLIGSEQFVDGGVYVSDETILTLPVADTVDGLVALDNDVPIASRVASDVISDATGVEGDASLYDNSVVRAKFETPALLRNKFPFCIPYDFVTCFTSLRVDQKEPVFNIDLGLPDELGNADSFTLDLTSIGGHDLGYLWSAGRWLCYALFLFCLMLGTKGLISH